MVGGFNPSEKKILVSFSWDDYSHILWTNKKCSKPPTSICEYCIKLINIFIDIVSHSYFCYN